MSNVKQPQLFLAATGHTYSGLCPDSTQPLSRDSLCPACKLLMEFESRGILQQVVAARLSHLLSKLAAVPINIDAELRQKLGEALTQELAAGAKSPDWSDSREVDRLIDCLQRCISEHQQQPADLSAPAIAGPGAVAMTRLFEQERDGCQQAFNASKYMQVVRATDSFQAFLDGWMARAGLGTVDVTGWKTDEECR